jgi:hypothetical protein
MKLKAYLLVAICAVATSLALPAGATAKPGGGEREAEAHLAGTHGYRIAISATSEEVLVLTRNGSAGVSYVSFAGGLKRDRIHVRLPGVGRISLRFHERSRSHGRRPSNCRGSGRLTRKGVFVGMVKIRGEHDYTSAQSRHVRGEIVERSRDRCHRRTRATASSGSLDTIRARTERGSGNLFFQVHSFPSSRLRSEADFVALLMRVRGEMVVMNAQVVFAEDATSLEIAAPPRSATVEPPAPFTGSATFQQESAHQFSWLGDLAVELPGVGEVTLAGPKFETELCVDDRCRGDKEENATSVAVPRAYGSGSHSQPLALARLSSLR